MVEVGVGEGMGGGHIECGCVWLDGLGWGHSIGPEWNVGRMMGFRGNVLASTSI